MCYTASISRNYSTGLTIHNKYYTMIVQTDSRLAEKSEEFFQKGFNIKSGAKAFQILTSTLYSNKGLAVIRELTCNAYDAQKENGTLDIPVEIHLPNTYEQWFSIRDFGPGISQKFMMGDTIYTDYSGNTQKVGYTTAFHSTRDSSNDSIGGFGIGRLAALAISDSYSVVSITKNNDDIDWRSNVRRFYSVFMEGGLPNIVMMGEEQIIYNPDDKSTHTGFEVKVTIADHEKFCKEALNFLSNIDFKIKLSGSSREITQKEVAFECNGWRAFSGLNYRNNSVFAKMGIVSYPIDPSYLPPDLRDKYFEMDFPVGSLEVTPSRESLSYNETTIKLISDRIPQIIGDIKNIFKSKIESCKSLWEARKINDTFYRGDLSRFYSLSWRSQISDFRYKGNDATSIIGLRDFLRVNRTSTIQDASKSNKFHTNEFIKYELQNKYRRHSIATSIAKIGNCENIAASDSVIFVIDDSFDIDGNSTKKIVCSHARIRKYILNKTDAVLFVFSQRSYDLLNKTGLIDGAPSPVLLSQMPYDPIVRTKSTTSKKRKLFDNSKVLYVKKDSTNHINWDVDKPLPKEGYYCPLRKCEEMFLLDGNTEYGLPYLNGPTKLKFCEDLNIPVKYIFGIHKTKVNSFLEEYPNWKPLSDLDNIIKIELDKRTNGVTFEDFSISFNGLDIDTGVSACKILRSSQEIVRIKDSQNNAQISNLKKLLDLHLSQDSENLLEIAKFYKIKLEENTNITKAYKKLIHCYPALEIFGVIKILESTGSHRKLKLSESIDELYKIAADKNLWNLYLDQQTNPTCSTAQP